MSQKLPAEFDAERYAAAYPDVRLSGLDPRDHYLRFGRLLGRSPVGKIAGPSPATPEVPAPAKPAPRPRSVGASDGVATKPDRTLPIIDRPADFDASDALPLPAPPKPGAKDGIYALATIAEGPVGTPEERARSCAPLLAYAHLLSLDTAGLPEPLETTVGGALFRTGATRIENAWFADPSRLRLMLGGPVSDASAKGWSMRAYQADTAGPGELEAAGQGVQLPASGPVFHDVELVHPLMPLLLELTDAEGVIRDIALLPFPSLLPGGIHGAELKALQNEPNPMDAFWSLSETLLQEAIGRPDWPSRSITELAVGGSGMLPEPLTNWLTAVFGLSVSQASATPVSGMRLVLPPGAVPSISALVSRGLDPGEGRQATGPFLVVDEGTLRPRWSVTLPSDTACEAELPFIQRDGRPSRGKQKPKPLPVHLAIVVRSDSPAAVPGSGDTDAATAALRQESLPLTVLLHSSDPERTEAQRRALTEFGGDALELIAAAPDTDLRDVAASARHDTILTLSDRVHFSDEALHTLAGLIRKDEQTASASCVLLAETMFKKQTVLRPATGGLFPSRVSFAASPRLGFVEPDVLQALSGLTYPVVANTFQFTLWRRAALAELPRPSGPVPRSAADIRVGLDLIEAGYRNLCTCTVAVRLAGAYARRDEIDPVGAAYLQPARWEDLLGRVTVLRELF